jgi:hypothetical protein
MHLARRVSLTMATLLVEYVGTASAECAWVLWTLPSACFRPFWQT